MRSHGVVIYLSAPVSVLVDRLEATPEEGLRPTLTGKPLTEEVQEVLAQRDVLYREAAHYIVDATNAPAQVVEDILGILAQAAPRLQGGVYT
ncbi:Shikimate kinase 2 [bioreactor metagenome]|jgi:shikimate kinase